MKEWNVVVPGSRRGIGGNSWVSSHRSSIILMNQMVSLQAAGGRGIGVSEAVLCLHRFRLYHKHD